MKLLNWFRRAELESDLARELQYHLERRTADLMASGVSEPEARRRAALELGGSARIREEVSDVWLGRWLRDFLYDLRFSLRALRRSPSFTATALLSFGLGIGATTAIYSMVDQVILHSLPVRDPERLVLVDWKGDQAVGGFGTYNLMSYPICRDLQQQIRFFEGAFCRAATTLIFSSGSDPKPTSAVLVSGSYFAVLGVAPALGRLIRPEDDAVPDASPVVVLSYDFWQSQFGGAPDAIGRKVLINNHPMTIIGVAAASFRGIDVGDVPSLWIPAAMHSHAMPGTKDLLDSPTRWLQILGRLQPGVTTSQAQAGLQPWFKHWLEDNIRRPGFPAITPERRQRYFSSRLALTPAAHGHSPLRRSLSEPLWVLFAGTAILLGLACLNVAGLFLARGSARGREISTRLALGASPTRIGRQLITDSLLLALAGGAFGVVLAPLALRALIQFLPRDQTSIQSSLNVRLLGFGFLASFAAGLLSGLAPAIQVARNNLTSAMRERAGTSFGNVRLRKCIVTLQVAFSLVLVIGAALFVRTLTSLLGKGPGFDTASLVSFELKPRQSGYSPAQASQLTRRLHDEISALPITRSSAVVSNGLLLGGSWMDPVTIQTGRRFVTDRDIHLNAATPGFFATLGVRLVAGRDFDRRDSRPIGQTGPRSAIVTEAFVKRYLAGRNPLGVRFGIGSGPTVKPEIEIIGVAADFSYRGLRDEAEQAWFPIFEGEDRSGGTFYVRVHGSPRQAFESIRQTVARADPPLPILRFRTVNGQVKRSLSNEHILAAISSSFGALALLLSLIGLYGVMSFVVARRTREIGIRLALGATGASTIKLVLWDAAVMIAAGIAIALPCVAALGKLVQSLLFGVTANDPVTIAGATLLLATASIASALLPARRAALLNPTEALRLD